MNSYADSLKTALAPTREPTDYDGVFVSRLSAAGWSELERWRSRAPDWRSQVGIKLLALALTDEAGNPVLTDSQVGNLPCGTMDQLGRRAVAVNGTEPTPPAGPPITIEGPPALPGLTAFHAGRVPLLLRRLTDSDRRAYARTFGPGNHGWRAVVWAVSRSLVDPRGGRAISEADLWGADGGAVLAAWGEVDRLNRITH